MPVDKQDEESSIAGKHTASGIYEAAIKRPLDMILSTAALILLSPVIAVVAIAVRQKLGSPCLFKQQRPGLNGKIFTIYKFRTMTDQKDADGNPLPDKERLTPFGKMLRSTSLDELPELINIVRGDMAIVGPRPLLVEYLSRYNEQQAHRHDVRPGLTGLAQVSGRNSLPWEMRFKEDINYVNNISFLGDCKIILKTIKTVLTRTGINSEASATMETFTGEHKRQDQSTGYGNRER